MFRTSIETVDSTESFADALVTSDPEYSFYVFERKQGHADYLVVDVVLAPWGKNQRPPHFYYIKRWATRYPTHNKFIEEVIEDFLDSSAYEAGWYRMDFSKFQKRTAAQDQLRSSIVLESNK